METTSKSTWIWYPGDFEIWLGNRFNNRRTERGAMFPPFWKQDSHWVTVEISKPDYALRRDVINMKALQDGLTIADDVLDYIATNVADSVRELEGIMTSLLAYSTVLNSDITIDLASSVISNAVKTTKKQITFEMIVETVCSFYDVNTDAVYGTTRKREISDARQLVMYLAKEHTQLSSTTRC